LDEIRLQNFVASARANTMSLPSDTDTTNQQPINPTIDADAVMAAAAAAAADAVGSTVEQSTASGTDASARICIIFELQI
jgi:DhnA family fructose-bisphosphate aldolase class Ia